MPPAQTQPQPPTSPPEPSFQPPQMPAPMPSEPPKKSKSLAIVLILAVILMLAAGGVAWWLYMQKNSSTGTVTQQPSAQDTSTVTKVTWVAPATLPATYVKRDQSTATNQLTYYTDEATACAITTTVGPLAAGKSAKTAVQDSINAAASLGVKTTSNKDGKSYTIKDADATHQYPFASAQLVQSVDVKGIDFTEQQNVIAYKQFNQQFANIGIACKTQSWAAQKDALEALLQQFTVKTER